jgi:diadenosine tetraphosphate (Ap4A) HIT family hydrolase
MFFMHFRKKRTLEKYYAYRENKPKTSRCDFCVNDPVEKKEIFIHWKIIKNIFPYDSIAEEHDLLIPKRHFQKESEMSSEEWHELVHIKTVSLSKEKKYDFIWENFAHMRSVLHYHLHLLRFKRSKQKS